MRFLWISCLVVLLSLSFFGATAPAPLYLGAAPPDPCPKEPARHTGKTSQHHQHQRSKALTCCCDCLGCTSAAYLPPELGVTLAELPARVHYDAFTASLSGRTLLPEPGPPPPRTLPQPPPPLPPPPTPPFP